MASLLAAAVVISRGNTETLLKTLTDLSHQTHPLQQVMVVEGSGSEQCLALAKSFGFGAISVEDAELNAMISAGIAGLQGGSSWLWILHHDSAPEPQTLQFLAQAAEISPSVAVIGPKQLDWDHPIQIKQLGLTTTKTARPFTLVEDEFDQGQYDAKGDTLAVSTAGMLVAMELWHKIGGLNPATPGYAQDIEFCIKARALGYRVIVEPKARILVKGSLTSELYPKRKLFGGRAEALAKAHVHLATILWPGALLPLLYLAMPLVVALSIPINLLQKRPARIIGQLSAWLFSWFTVPTRLAARRQARSLGSLSSIQKLYASREQVAQRRARRFEEEPEPEFRTKGFVESGAIWLSLIPLLAGYALFPQGALAREGLVPLGRFAEGIFGQVAASTQGYLDGVRLPSDPYNWFLALIGFLWPASPNAALAWFLFLTPVLLFSAFWFLSGLVTRNHFLKNAAALLVSSSLPFALMQREAGVTELTAVVFAIFAAFFLTKSAFAFNLARAWRWLGLAGLAGSLVAISSPILFGFLILLSLVLASLQVRRLGVLIWFGLPGLVLLWPWIEFVFQSGRFEFFSVSSAAELLPFDPYQNPAWLISLLAIALLALMASLPRPGLSLALWVLALAMLYGSSLQPIAGSYELVFSSLVVLALLIVAGVDRLASNWRVAATSGIALLALVSLGFGIVQPLQFEFVQDRQVPALVMASSDVDPATRTLKIDVVEDGFSAELVWGDGRNQEETSLLYGFLRPESDVETELAQLSASLIAGNPQGVAELLESTGVDFILVAPDVNPRVQIALDSLTLLQSSGQTSFGLLWRVVEQNSTPKFEPSYFPQRDIQLWVIAGFLLLAIPTPSSITGRRLRRAA